MNDLSKQYRPFNNLKLSKFYFLLVFSTLFFIHFFNLATQVKSLEFDPEDPYLEGEVKARKENQEVMWDPVFNNPYHTLTKWDGDVKVVKTATETPNNLLLLTSRAYDAQNNLLWGHEDTWDRTYNKNFNVLGKKKYESDSTEEDPKVKWEDVSWTAEYDEKGLYRTKQLFYSAENKVKWDSNLTWFEEYYEENGKTFHNKTFFYSDSEEGNLKKKCVIKYDNRGNILHFRFYKKQGENEVDWENRNTLDFEYEKATDGKLFKKFVKKYTKDGKKVSELLEFDEKDKQLSRTKRFYNDAGEIEWVNKDTSDAVFDENNNQTKELYFAPESTSEADKKVDYQNESTCHYFYDQEGLNDGFFNRKRHYTLEDDQLKVDWAHKNTYDWEYNEDNSPKRKKFFNADGSVNWQFVANSKECTFDFKWIYENGEVVNFSIVPVPEEYHAAEDELQNYKLEAYKLVQEEDVVKVVNKLMNDEKFQIKLQESGLQEALQEIVKVLLDEEVNNLVVAPVKKLFKEKATLFVLDEVENYHTKASEKGKPKDTDLVVKLLDEEVNKFFNEEDQEKVKEKLSPFKRKVNSSEKLPKTVKELVKETISEVKKVQKEELDTDEMTEKFSEAVKKLLSNTTDELLLQNDRDKQVFKGQIEELNTKEKLPKPAKKLVLQLVKDYVKEQALENFDDEEDKGLVKVFFETIVLDQKLTETVKEYTKKLLDEFKNKKQALVKTLADKKLEEALEKEATKFVQPTDVKKVVAQADKDAVKKTKKADKLKNTPAQHKATLNQAVLFVVEKLVQETVEQLVAQENKEAVLDKVDKPTLTNLLKDLEQAKTVLGTFTEPQVELEQAKTKLLEELQKEETKPTVQLEVYKAVLKAVQNQTQLTKEELQAQLKKANEDKEVLQVQANKVSGLESEKTNLEKDKKELAKELQETKDKTKNSKLPLVLTSVGLTSTVFLLLGGSSFFITKNITIKTNNKLKKE
ncbi:MAG: hypothetical protein ACQBVK_00400 [Candidatus Phytoplasma sp. TWB_XP]